MHNHDPQLVAALAEGTLDRETASAAEAEIASCARCSADLAAQQVALEAVAAAPRPHLSATEADRLYAAVADAVGFSPADVAPSPDQTRRVSWGALAVAAAALTAIVAIVPVLGLLQTGDDDEAAVTFAAEITADDTEATGAGRNGDAGAAEPAPAADELAVAESSASPETTRPAAAGAPTTSTTLVAEAAEAALKPIEGIAGLERRMADGSIGGYLDTERSADRQCVTEARAELGPAAQPLIVPVLLADGSEAAAFVDGDRTRAAVFDTSDCTLRFTAP